MKYMSVFLCLYLLNSAAASNEVTAQGNLEIDVTDQNLYKFELLEDLPNAVVQHKIIDKNTLDKINARKISDIIKADTSLSESYSSIGYSDSVSIRGIALNSQNNYLRDGLPFLVDAPVQFENKSQIEIIKGTYGIFSGLSSPGGIVNYVTEKPTLDKTGKIKTELTSAGQFAASVGANSYVDDEKKYIYRFNLGATKLNANLKNSAGHKYLASLALKAEPAANWIFESNIESSYQSQASQPGFSLLGTNVPTVADPDLNLNNQSWTQPVQFKNLIGSFKLSYQLASKTKISLSGLEQIILTNDRVSFPFGCSTETRFDRFCSDGTFDMYDFRSENEKRKNSSYQINLNHKFQFIQTEHTISLSTLNRNVSENYDKQAYNLVGIGNTSGTIQNPENSLLADENTNKKSRTNEVTVFHQLQFKKIITTLGLKYASLSKQSIRTNETRKTDINQNFTLPWVTISYKNNQYMFYTSYSEGIESYVTPNKSSYNLPGQNIPDATSRQIEFGFKNLSDNNFEFSVFQMKRPQIEDSAPDFKIDGLQKNNGLEINYHHKLNNFDFEISGLILDSKTENATLNPQKNNKKTVNIPQYKLRLNLDYNLSSIRGLSLQLASHHSAYRYITSDNQLSIPDWTTVDLGGQYQWQTINKISLIIENILNTKYWKESPTQFGHIYLFPGESRKLTLNYTKDFN